MVGLNYNHLRYFWAVARDGNLTRTANKLNVSQSALSLQIRKLEERLGVDLFERRGKQLFLTEAGQIALDHADSIFRTGEELLDTLLQRTSDRGTPLRVGALSTLSRNFQAQFLRPALTLGQARIHVRSGSLAELTVLLQAQKLDVVLTNQVSAQMSDVLWVSHLISEQPVSLVGYPRHIDPARTLEDLLAQEPLIIPSKENSIRLGFDALIDRLGVTPRILAEVDDMALMRVLSREDIALAVVPPIVVEQELASGRLVELAELPGISETFYALTMPRRYRNPALAAVLKAASAQ